MPEVQELIFIVLECDAKIVVAREVINLRVKFKFSEITSAFQFYLLPAGGRIGR